MPPNDIAIPKKNDAEAIIELAKEAFPPRTLIVNADGRETEVLILPEGLEAHSIKPFLDEYLEAPERRKGTAIVQDLDSFIEHVERFKDDDSALFADPSPTAPTLTAVLDYHRAGGEGAPRFGEHRTRYVFPLSEEWRAWAGKNAQQMSQKDFAEFIEDRLADIADPEGAGDSARSLADKLGGAYASPSRLRDLSRDFSMREGAVVKEARNLSTGEVQLSYVTQHQDETGAPLKVPNLFLLHVPVFQMGVAYEVAVRLRYRSREGRIVWFYELYRPDRIFRDAFDDACHQAKSDTGLPLFVGHPE